MYELILDLLISNIFQAADWINFNECAFTRSTVSNFEDSITVGSAGAPGPPREKGSDKILKHSRPSRPKRQAQKERAQQRRSGATNNQKVLVPTGPSFTEDDFPPLG